MSSISDRSLITTSFLLLVIFAVRTECRPQQQQAYLPAQPQPIQQQAQSSNSNSQTFYIPPAAGAGQQQQPLQQQLSQLPFLAQSSNPQSSAAAPQQTQPPIQLSIPIPNDDVEEKRIYVQLPPQQQYHPQQAPQYRYPPRKHYKIILVRSPSPPTPPPAPVLPQIEEHTLVYVLVKKPDTPSLVELQQLQQQSYKLHKPEVYFIKYKANEQRSGTIANNDGSLGSDVATGTTGTSSSSGLVEKSIEHQQVSNNLESGGGYSYDGARKREAKNLNESVADEAHKVAEQQ